MAEAPEAPKVQHAEKDVIKSIFRAHLEEGSAIALWRQPCSSRKDIIICTEGIGHMDELPLEDLPTGFAIAPFDSEAQKIFLRANKSYSIENGEISQNIPSPRFNPAENGAAKGKINFYPSPPGAGKAAVQKDFAQLVKEAIHQIGAGNFEKLVPSRCKTIELPANFELLETFDALCTKYPNAFVSLVSAPGVGTWLGASPELLVSVNDQMRFKTVAVAGTQVLHPLANPRHLAWTQKEIEEQALVSRYIINCFKKIRLREFTELGPKTWQAGNLVHLKTEFEVDMAATNFPQLGSTMLKLLHPTSAVCGMPRERSIAFIKAHEPFDRGFYSGYLGPVNHEGGTSLYVNLRCLSWSGDKAVLYAGAGVTIDSIPEKEWEETELKMKTLLEAIQS